MAETPKRWFIIAPTTAQALAYVQERALSPYTVVSEPDRLRGLNNPSVAILGWPDRWTNNDIRSAQISLGLADRGSMTVVQP